MSMRALADRSDPSPEMSAPLVSICSTCNMRGHYISIENDPLYLDEAPEPICKDHQLGAKAADKQSHAAQARTSKGLRTELIWVRVRGSTEPGCGVGELGRV